jgi:hypothetical protein
MKDRLRSAQEVETLERERTAAAASLEETRISFTTNLARIQESEVGCADAVVVCSAHASHVCLRRK